MTFPWTLQSARVARFLCLIAASTPFAAIAQSEGPLSRAEILTYLRTEVTPYGTDWEKHEVGIYRLCELVKRRGVSFSYGEGTPTGFDEEMHSAAGGTTGRSASGERCDLTQLVQANRRSATTTPDDALRTQSVAPPSSLVNAQAANSPDRDGPVPSQVATAPRLATYYVMTYGNVFNPLRIGTFELLADGQYKVYLNGEKPAGGGRYRFDPGGSTVHWLSGPYSEFGASAFSVTRGGSTHRIEFNRTTVGFNDTP